MTNANADTSGRTRLLIALVLAGLVAMIAAFVPSPLKLLASWEGPQLPIVKAPPPLKLTALPPKERFAEIAARPIFNQDRRADPSASVAAAPVDGAADEPEDLAQYHLVGIVTDATTRLALLRNANGATTKVRAGDTLNGWRIEKIDVSGVTATDGIRSARLVIPRSQKSAATP